MKNYVSYVVQDSEKYTHHSEIIDIKIPPYNYSNDPDVSAVMKWAEKKQIELLPNERLVILNIIKL